MIQNTGEGNGVKIFQGLKICMDLLKLIDLEYNK